VAAAVVATAAIAVAAEASVAVRRAVVHHLKMSEGEIAELRARLDTLIATLGNED